MLCSIGCEKRKIMVQSTRGIELLTSLKVRYFFCFRVVLETVFADALLAYTCWLINL
jgi:hypothetical protein